MAQKFLHGLCALSGVLKASPGLLGHVSERVPAGTERKDLHLNETARDHTVT